MGNRREVTGIFLQVRLDSSRLPNKALLPLAGMTVIEHVMAGLADIGADFHVLLTDKASEEKLKGYGEKWGFEVFAGPADDVLLRYVLAAEEYGVSTIIRATGDNPLVSKYLAEEILEIHFTEAADYSGFLGMPLGTGVEIIKTSALQKAEADAVDLYEREHVSPYLYRHPELFTIRRPYAPEEFLLPEGRVTLDTEKDYRFIQGIYDDLYSFQPIETDRLVEWLAETEVGRVTEKVPM